jgi:hypothetical protein
VAWALDRPLVELAMRRVLGKALVVCHDIDHKAILAR